MEKVTGSGGGWFLEIDERRIALSDGEFTVGRSRGCGVVLRDPSVSRGHALLCVAGGRVTLQDLQSSNGTFVNGKRLEGEVPLAPGDRLVFGETELYLQWAGEGGVPAPSEESRLFCPACGLPIAGPRGRCGSCGATLGGKRLPHRSEAIALGEVLPVGEVLSASSGSWDATRFRRSATPSPPTLPDPPPASSRPASQPAGPAPVPLPAPAVSEPPDPVRELPMSVREAERGSGAQRPVPLPASPPTAPPEPARQGLLARLAALLRRRRAS